MFAKWYSICAIFLGFAVLLSAPARARDADASATGVATATVVQPLTATAVAQLDFGTVAVSLAQGGGVVVAPGGLASYIGSARQACLSGRDCSLPHPATFQVSGEAGRDYRVILPNGVVARSDGGQTLGVEALVVRTRSRPGDAAIGTLDPQGRDQFEIGGTIRIPAGAATARYSATIAVIVTYS